MYCFNVDYVGFLIIILIDVIVYLLINSFRCGDIL